MRLRVGTCSSAYVSRAESCLGTCERSSSKTWPLSCRPTSAARLGSAIGYACSWSNGSARPRSNIRHRRCWNQDRCRSNNRHCHCLTAYSLVTQDPALTALPCWSIDEGASSKIGAYLRGSRHCYSTARGLRWCMPAKASQEERLLL
jgi:hypothetical protein